MIEVRLAGKEDLPKVAACHRLAFPGSLTSRLGLTYLEVLYSWYLSNDKTFLMVTERASEVVGYCGGMVSDGTMLHGSSSSMTQFTFPALVRAMISRPWLFFHPDFLSRYSLIFRNIGYRVSKLILRRDARSAKAPAAPYVGLVVIGVAPDARGKGYGSALLNSFQKVAGEKGINNLQLTVSSDNVNALKSYKQNGWKIVRDSGKTIQMTKTFTLL